MPSGFRLSALATVADMGFTTKHPKGVTRCEHKQLPPSWWSQRRCWSWEARRRQPAVPQQAYGYQTAAVVTPVAVRRPVAAAAVVRRGAVVPRVGSGARIAARARATEAQGGKLNEWQPSGASRLPLTKVPAHATAPSSRPQTTGSRSALMRFQSGHFVLIQLRLVRSNSARPGACTRHPRNQTGCSDRTALDRRKACTTHERHPRLARTADAESRLRSDKR